MENQLLLLPSDRTDNFVSAVDLLNPIVVPLLWKAHKDAFDEIGERILKDVSFECLEWGERAQFLHRQVIRRLKGLLAEYGGSLNCKWIRVHRMDVLNVDDQVYLSFKKLNRGLRRSNYHTNHNDEYWTQSGLQRPLKLVAGYRPNAQWNDARYYLTLPTGRGGTRVGEWTPIGDQTDKLIQLTTATVPAVTPAEAPRRLAISARPKTSVARRKKAGGSDAS